MINFSNLKTLIYIKKINKLIEQLYHQQLSKENGVYQGEITEIQDADKFKFHVSIGNGKEIKNIPYTQYYKDYFQKIKKYLHKIAHSKQNIIPAGFVVKFIEVCETNKREELEIARLKTINDWNGYIRTIGPIESYSDKKYGIKKYFSGLLMKKINDENIKIFLENLMQNLDSFEKENNFQKANKNIKFIIGKIVDNKGESKILNLAGRSRPENTEILKKYGSVKQLFTNSLNKRIKNYYIKLMKIFLSKEEFKIYSKFIKKYYIYYVTTHELSHTIGKPNNYKKNFSGIYPSTEETRADILAYTYLNYLEKNQKIGFETNFTENIIAISFFSLLHMYYLYKTQGIRKAYHDLFCIFWYGLKENFKFKDNKILIDKTNIVENLIYLYSQIQQIIYKGDKKEFENLLQESQNFVDKNFKSGLKLIKL